MWDFATRELLGVVGRGVEFVSCVSFSPRGDYLYAVAMGNVHEWRLTDDEIPRTRRLYDMLVGLSDQSMEHRMRVSAMRLHNSFVRRLCFTADSSELLMDGEEYGMHTRNVHTGEFVHSYKGLSGDSISGIDCSSDGASIAAITDTKFMIWNTKTEKCSNETIGALPFLQGRANAVKFHPDATMCCVGCGSSALVHIPSSSRRWDEGASRFSTRLERAIECISFFPDGSMMAVSLDDGTICVRGLREYASRTYLAPIDPDGRAAGLELREYIRLNGRRPPTSPVADVVVSPDGECLVVATRGGPIAVFRVAMETDPSDWKYVLLDAGRRGVNNVSFFPQGRFFAASGNDNTVQLWDTQTREQVLALKGHSSSVKWVCFSPDGRKLASTDYRDVLVWDLFDGELCIPLVKSSHGEKYDKVVEKLVYSEVAVTTEPEKNTYEGYEPPATRSQTAALKKKRFV